MPDNEERAHVSRAHPSDSTSEIAAKLNFVLEHLGLVRPIGEPVDDAPVRVANAPGVSNLETARDYGYESGRVGAPEVRPGPQGQPTAVTTPYGAGTAEYGYPSGARRDPSDARRRFGL